MTGVVAAPMACSASGNVALRGRGVTRRRVWAGAHAQDPLTAKKCVTRKSRVPRLYHNFCEPFARVKICKLDIHEKRNSFCMGFLVDFKGRADLLSVYSQSPAPCVRAAECKNVNLMKKAG